ncbi:hypothetical protein [Vibrio diazotrophicus]|uniref:hypothetical protein n=1 Tax=Vibrio diazotrophicus TaxID=685 RepID=UPI0015E0FD23|nr:hypothetical protein [Vibrio diazotrophicus]
MARQLALPNNQHGVRLGSCSHALAEAQTSPHLEFHYHWMLLFCCYFHTRPTSQRNRAVTRA